MAGDDNPHLVSLAASQTVQDLILVKVARRAWENELLSKFSKSYICKTVIEPSRHLNNQAKDNRDDDQFLKNADDNGQVTEQQVSPPRCPLFTKSIFFAQGPMVYDSHAQDRIKLKIRRIMPDKKKYTMKRKSSASPMQFSARGLREIAGSRGKFKSPGKRKESDVSISSTKSKVNLKKSIASKNQDASSLILKEMSTSIKPTSPDLEVATIENYSVQRNKVLTRGKSAKVVI